MNRLVGITFNANNDNTNVGFMEYVTGVTKDHHYAIKRYKKEPLENRYFVEHGNIKINICDFINETDLIKIERLYLKKQNTNRIVFFIVQLVKWEKMNYCLEKELIYNE